jgi:AraC-like DNA-binding protein
MKYHRHLFLTEKKLPASIEWMESNSGWLFLRLHSGAAYWLGKGFTGELNPSNVLIASPGAEGQIRASQLGEARFHYFQFCPELAVSFLTLSEEHYLEKVAGKSFEKAKILPPTGLLTRAFANLVCQGDVQNTFVDRSRMLEAASLAFMGEMARHQAPAATGGSAEQRFRDLIQQMPGNELVNHSPEQLASLCGCSVRHFSRLFRKHLGSTIRGRQTELKLLKARQLLTETDSKIIHVALSSPASAVKEGIYLRC